MQQTPHRIAFAIAIWFACAWLISLPTQAEPWIPTVPSKPKGQDPRELAAKVQATLESLETIADLTDLTQSSFSLTIRNASLGTMDLPPEDDALSASSPSDHLPFSGTHFAAKPILQQAVDRVSGLAAKQRITELLDSTRAKLAAFDAIRDYQCVIMKRERVDGILSPWQKLRLSVLRSQPERQIPHSVYVEFETPRSVAGRKAIYVHGLHDSMVLVRRGGTTLPFLKLRIHPESVLALSETNYPITQIGIDNGLQQIVNRAEAALRADPSCHATEISISPHEQVADRSATVIHTVYRSRLRESDLHSALIAIDHETRLPIQIETRGWPKSPDDTPPLLEAFQFSEFRFNIGLTSRDFDPQRLD